MNQMPSINEPSVENSGEDQMPSINEPSVENSGEDQSSVIIENPEENDSQVKINVLPSGGIDVVALRDGFYEQRRIKKGEGFICRKFEELGSWMSCKDPQVQSLHIKAQKEKKAK